MTRPHGAAGAYSLDDEDHAEDVELFYSEAGGSTTTAPRQPDFLPMSSAARPTSAYTASSASAGVAQFEVEEPKGVGALGGVTENLWKRLSPASYNSYFQLNVSDLTTRISRALVPTSRLLVPPLPPLPISSEDAEEEDEELASGMTSVASPQPFNKEVDLYGPIWLTTTLVLCIAVGANILLVFRALARKSDTPQAVSALTALNFRHLVQASSIVYTYTIAATAATVFGKRYNGDESSRDVVFVLCVYGYAVAPFVPAVLLCAIPNAWLNWMFMMMAVAVSAYFLCINLWTAGAADGGGTYGAGASAVPKSPRWWMRIACIVCHVLFGVVLKLRFF